MKSRDETVVKRARLACGISQKEASEIVGFKCIQPYNKREQDPDDFTIGEFFNLYHSMDSFAQKWLWEFIEKKRRAS